MPSKLMTTAEVRRRVAEVAKQMDDDEAAHVKEDQLFEDVLKAISQGVCEDPAACAREALKSCRLDFQRNCA